MGLFPAILMALEASQTIADVSSKFAAVWPISYSQRYDHVMFIAAMAIGNIQLRVSGHILHERQLNAHQYAEDCLEI